MKSNIELSASKWLNTPTPLSIESLRGKVIAVFAFQMLCPGCVEYSIPQARKAHDFFSENDVAVLGLHTVFEEHVAMAEVSLKGFINQYGIKFPVGIDKPSNNPNDPIPMTMRKLSLRGTPSLLLFDKTGKLRINQMGHVQDLVLGAQVANLVNE